MIKISSQYFFTHIPAIIVGKFVPADGIGAGWIPFEYQFDDFTGTGIATGAHSPAGEIVCDLKLNGWHRLYIAFNPQIRVWLDGDNTCHEVSGSSSNVRDYFCFEADFTGKKLHIAPVRGMFSNKELRLFYIRAVPCKRYISHKNLIATNDGHGVFYHGVDTIKDISKYIVKLKNSDFFRIVWGVYGGGLLNTRHDSNVSEKLPFSDDYAFYHGEWVFNHSIENILKQGYDPLNVVRDATGEAGLELHFYFRVAAFYKPFPHHGTTLKFFSENPQWHCIDEYGRPVKRISYAFSEVQQRILDYFEELLDYNPDGICLAFNRGLPLMICEKPVIDEFEKTYARKPKLPEETDSKEMLQIRHKILSDFISRVYKLVCSHGKVLSCIVPRDFERNLMFGLDIEQMVKSNFFESVLVGAGHHDDPELNLNLEQLKNLKVSGTKVYPGGSGVIAHGGAWKPGDTKARACFMKNILDHGFDGAFFWDLEQIIESGTEWEILRQFGDRGFLSEVIEGKFPDIKYHKTLKIHDLIVDRYNPWNAY